MQWRVGEGQWGGWQDGRGPRQKLPSTHGLKGKWGVTAGRIEQVVQVLVGPIRPLVSVAIGDGEDEEDEDCVDDQLEEDSVRQPFLLTAFSGRLQDFLWHRLWWLGFSV